LGACLPAKILINNCGKFIKIFMAGKEAIKNPAPGQIFNPKKYNS